MNDFVAHIAEVEGIKTPTKTRTREDLTKAFDSFTEKRTAKKVKTAKNTAPKRKFQLDVEVIVKKGPFTGEKHVISNATLVDGKWRYQLRENGKFVDESDIRLPIGTDQKGKPVPVTKISTKLAEPVPMNFISPTGFVREAAFDPKSKLFYVSFAKSTWAFTATAQEWETFEKAVADPLTEIDVHYRKAFRGRGADMVPVRKSEVTK